MKTHEHRAATVKQTTCLCRDTGGKGTLPAQHTTFNTLDNWAIKTPSNQIGKAPERKGYRVMARNMYTIHSVTSMFNNSLSTVLNQLLNIKNIYGSFVLIRNIVGSASHLNQFIIIMNFPEGRECLMRVILCPVWNLRAFIKF